MAIINRCEVACFRTVFAWRRARAVKARQRGLILRGRIVTAGRHVQMRICDSAQILTWLFAALLLPMSAQGETLQEAYALAHQNDPK